jgi:hypothetical protein
MADSKISALPASTTPLAGTEVLPIVQSSTTKQVSVANLTAGRDIAATSLTTAAVQATNSGGLTLKNSSGTTQIAVGAGGGDNVTLSVATNITPANAAVAISPTGTGTVTINPNTASTMNNVAIGGTTPLAGKFTSVTNTALTSGRVTYAGTSGVLQDSSGLVFDSSSNLGVGTSSPTKRLEVQSSTTGGQNARFIDNSGVGGGGRGGGISMGGVSNDTGPVFTDYVRLLGLKQLGTQGDTQGFLLIQVDNGSGFASAMSISSARIVTMDAYGAGAATFSASGVISSVSDETWKTKDGVPTNTDAMLQKLEPGYWFYNEEKAPIFGADRQLGFYAQNVHEAIGSEAAPTPEEGKPWGYYDRSVLAVAVMSLKNALNTIEELKQRIEVLENK